MRGYARDVDSARIVHVFHTIAAALGLRVWFAYVASKANLADLPSRGSFCLLEQELLSSRVELHLPPLELSWSGAFSALFQAFLDTRPRQAKRARQRVYHHVDAIVSARRASV